MNVYNLKCLAEEAKKDTEVSIQLCGFEMKVLNAYVDKDGYLIIEVEEQL